MFPLISSITQQQPTNQPTPIKKPSINPPSKNLTSSFSESFITSGKQGDGATVLGEGCDNVT
jgi:hypothetical protein